MRFLVALLLSVAPILASSATWSVKPTKNPEGPGSAIEVVFDGKPIARFIHGEGQMKPYLHVFGEDGERLTNGGLDPQGKPAGLFPHHRGIYIGWNKITSELGSDDLWHMTRGCRMEVQEVQHSVSVESAAIVARIGWHSAKKDTSGSDLLVMETRKLVISRPEGKRTQVDASFTVDPARDLTHGGDLQHAGIHFRAANSVADRKTETSYLWEPDVPGSGGKAVSTDFKWCRLLFPINSRWYEALQLNAPENPVEELSWRDYGRFGFFFKKDLKKGETLSTRYRFVIRPVDPKATDAKAFARQQYQTFTARH